MRVAVVQLELDPASRTATLQHALDAIDQAAEQDPAPDLLVLPAFADVLQASSDKSIHCERVHGPTTAACGQRARTWGIFIVHGQAERAEAGPFATSVLVDRDGDVRLAQRQVQFLDKSCRLSPGDSIQTADVLLCRLALLTADDLLCEKAWQAVARAKAQYVVGTACWKHDAIDDKVHETIAQFASQTGIGCAVADVTAEATGCRGWSAIFDDKGCPVAVAEAGVATTLWGNVTLPDPPADVASPET